MESGLEVRERTLDDAEKSGERVRSMVEGVRATVPLTGVRVRTRVLVLVFVLVLALVPTACGAVVRTSWREV